MKQPMDEKKRRVIVYEDIAKDKDFGLPLISDLIMEGKAESETLFISNVRFDEALYGAYAVIALENGGEYRTNSLVLIKQLENIKEHLGDYDIMQVQLKKIEGPKGEYYTFGKRPKNDKKA